MKKVLSILAITILTGSLWAATSGESLRSLYDVIAPVIAGNPVPADRQVGQIYFDVTANRFKGINKDGNIDILTNIGSGVTSVLKTSVYGASEDDLVFDGTGFGSGTSPVSFRNESYDIGGLYNPTSGVFTATANGQYTVTVSVYLNASYVTGDIASIQINYTSSLANGSNIINEERLTGDKNVINLFVTADLNLQAGDTVDISLFVFRIGGGPVRPSSFGGWASFKQIP